MSYSTTIQYPTSADVQAVALLLAQRQSDVGTTNGGITATPPNATVPQLGVDAAGASTAYLRAMTDAYMCSLGFQLASYNVLSANSTTSTSYVDVPGSSITFTARVAKNFTVHADFAFFQSAGALGQNKFRLVVNGSNGPDAYGTQAALGINSAFHTMHAASCVAGSNTIKLQYAAGAASTINVNAGSYANYIVSG